MRTLLPIILDDTLRVYGFNIGGLSQEDIEFTSLDDGMLIVHDPKMLEEIDPRSIGSAVGNEVILSNDYLNGCICIPFELMEFYVRQITTKSIEVDPIALAIKADGKPNIVMIRSNKIRNADTLTIRQMDTRTMRVTDGSSEDV